MFEDLKRLVDELEVDYNKWSTKNNSAAGLRVRKACKKFKNLFTGIIHKTLNKE